MTSNFIDLNPRNTYNYGIRLLLKLTEVSNFNMNKILDHLPKLIRSSLTGDLKSVELFSLTLIRLLKKEHPDVASEIAKALSFADVGAAVTRSIGLDPPPSDRDNFMMLAQL